MTRVGRVVLSSKASAGVGFGVTGAPPSVDSAGAAVETNEVSFEEMFRLMVAGDLCTGPMKRLLRVSLAGLLLLTALR